MMSVAPYSRARAAQSGREPTAYRWAAPRRAAPATAIRPTGPMPMTHTSSPNCTSASSTPWKPVGTMSLSITAAAMSMSGGSRARLASASLTWNSSPNTPSLKLENFHPASMPPECME